MKLKAGDVVLIKAGYSGKVQFLVQVSGVGVTKFFCYEVDNEYTSVNYTDFETHEYEIGYHRIIKIVERG